MRRASIVVVLMIRLTGCGHSGTPSAAGEPSAAEFGSAHAENFDQATAGAPPTGWSVDVTGKGEPLWTVENIDSAPSKPSVLKQSAIVPGSSFPLCIKNDLALRDGFVEVKFKSVSGKGDQAAGVIWRLADKDNYYICRANALENNVVLYKVENGKRKSLDIMNRKGGYGVEEKVAPQVWHTLRVEFVGKRAKVVLNGKHLFDVEDETFKDAGNIGLWTKGDSVMLFDDFRYAEASVAETARIQDSLTWSATRVAETPAIDGKAEALWDRAPPLTVTVRKAMGGHNSKSVVLRALYTEDALYVLAQWPDVTRSDMRDPYIWNPTNRTYERPTKPDDQFALEFPIKGDFDISMLALGRGYTADVWHWKAGRGNPAGWVDDKHHVISPTPLAEELVKKAGSNYQQYVLGKHATVYIARPLDSGTPSYRTVPPLTAHQGDTVDSYEPCEPSGSAADVRGKGLHDGKGWTLEMTRRFNTGHDDDAVLDSAKPITCAIAVLDDQLYWHHYVSPPIMLTFQQEGR